LCLFLRSESHGLVTSGAALAGGRRPLPVSAFGGPGAPPATAAEVAQTFRQSLQKNHKECLSLFVSMIFSINFSTDQKMGKLLETIRLTAIRKICYFWPQIPLVWIFHDLPAATEDMTALPGVLGCRPLRRTVQVRLGIQPPAVAQWRSHLHGLATAIH